MGATITSMLADVRVAKLRQRQFRDRLAELSQQCEHCADACAHYVDTCLDTGALDKVRQRVKAAADSIDICRATARLLARHDGGASRLLRQALTLCARACTTCARLAQRQAIGIVCADECRRCALACAAIAAELLWRL